MQCQIQASYSPMQAVEMMQICDAVKMRRSEKYPTKIRLASSTTPLIVSRSEIWSSKMPCFWAMAGR